MGYGSYAAGSSRVNEYSWKENYYTTNIYSDYFKQFDNGHYFKVMAGFNAELYKTRNITAEKNTLIPRGYLLLIRQLMIRRLMVVMLTTQ